MSIALMERLLIASEGRSGNRAAFLFRQSPPRQAAIRPALAEFRTFIRRQREHAPHFGEGGPHECGTPEPISYSRSFFG